MNVSAQKLNYHFKKLYESGFIYKKYEERKRGAFESFFQTQANIIKIDSSLFNDNEAKLFSHFECFDVVQHDLSDELNSFPKSFQSVSKKFNSKQELIEFIQGSEEFEHYHLFGAKKVH